MQNSFNLFSFKKYFIRIVRLYTLIFLVNIIRDIYVKTYIDPHYHRGVVMLMADVYFITFQHALVLCYVMCQQAAGRLL